jgi:hypothetical protein
MNTSREKSVRTSGIEEDDNTGLLPFCGATAAGSTGVFHAVNNSLRFLGQSAAFEGLAMAIFAPCR